MRKSRGSILSQRIHSPLLRNDTILRDARLIVVATEGSVTEKIYFLNFQNPKVKLEIVESQNGESSPQHVIENIRSFRRQYEIDADDELWIVIDRDSWKERMLSEVAASAVSENYYLAVSSPQFEFWLCLHLDASLPESIDGKSLQRMLRENLGGYNKNKYNVEKIFEGIYDAIRKAREMDRTPGDRWPQEHGSRVYLLVESILDHK